MSTLNQYEGKFVFIERANPTKENSSYYNGEYFVIRETPGTLYCARLAGVYELHNQTQFPLLGDGAYKVIESWRDDDFLKTQLSAAKAEIEAVRSGRKKENWVSYVYSGAEAVIARIERMLNQNPSIQLDLISTHQFIPITAGTKRITLQFQ